jgi:hypothetical protein
MGRVRRKLALKQGEARAVVDARPPVCALCGRALGERVEWHHPVPKSEGGADTVPVHPICHRTIHATFSNAALARDYADMASLAQHPAMARFIDWVADKPPDFHAPTRHAASDRI